MSPSPGAQTRTRSFLSSIVYVLFTVIGIIAAIVAISVLGALGLLIIAHSQGSSGPEMHLASISILGMAFYLGIEVANEFTTQFTSLMAEKDSLHSTVGAMEPDPEGEGLDEAAPLDFFAVFLWVGGIILVSVVASSFLLETSLAWLAIPIALLAGVFEIHLTSNEIPGPILLLAIAPFIVIYTVTGFTSTVKDLLPQRIALRNFRHLRVRKIG